MLAAQDAGAISHHHAASFEPLGEDDGLAIEDMAAACEVLERARAQGAGTRVPIFA